MNPYLSPFQPFQIEAAKNEWISKKIWREELPLFSGEILLHLKNEVIPNEGQSWEKFKTTTNEKERKSSLAKKCESFSSGFQITIRMKERKLRIIHFSYRIFSSKKESSIFFRTINNCLRIFVRELMRWSDNRAPKPNRLNLNEIS